MKATKSDAGKFENIVERLKNHFDERVEKYGAGLQSVDWKSRAAQSNRFRELLKIADFSAPFSILDYGCGDGELARFLNAAGADFQYFGFDVSPQMIEAARKEFADSNNCLFSTRLEDFPAADYAVASGVFNLRFDASDEKWREYMRATIFDLHRLSSKGFAFNALTSYSIAEFRREDLFYADPLHWFDFCKRNVSRFVSLLHDYPEYDFTILVRKNR
ncbi:MAG: class I SAM-dependent methyltransferase [Pyrinomonadaceae bacterium]|nr:class I SAM-dependent methyltransferase [Pyrinomonadaceae bacterium]